MTFFAVSAARDARERVEALIRLSASRFSAPRPLPQVGPASPLCAAWGHTVNPTGPGWCPRCGALTDPSSSCSLWEAKP